MKLFRSSFIKYRAPVRGIEELLPVSKKEGEEEIPEHKTGRSWKADDLRRKSFEDLHTLWHIIAKERVKLLSERKRDGSAIKAKGRFNKTKKSMARIKRVLHERDLIYRATENSLNTLQPVIEEQLRAQIVKLEEEKLNLLKILSEQKQQQLENNPNINIEKV